jgi:cytochrome c peroxidase
MSASGASLAANFVDARRVSAFWGARRVTAWRRSFAALALSLAACSGGNSDAEPDSSSECDLGALSAEDCELAYAMQLPDELPEARGNRYGDEPAAAEFGFSLFFDVDLGRGVGCPTCHLPELAFTDRRAVSLGQELGTRNAPTIFNAARLSVIFWDGRADSLWSQPLFAIENPVEMASSRLELAHHVAGVELLRTQYEAVFGDLPDMSDWPSAGKPGDAEFDALDADSVDAVNRVAANVGKALEAYARKNTSGPSDFDRYLAGDSSALIGAAQRGLATFFSAGCAECHSGPLLSDEGFHDVGFPSLPDAPEDPGHAGALEVLANNVFNLEGPYADPLREEQTKKSETSEGIAFRTPSLRNVAKTAPYGHDGAFASLRDVLSEHATMLSDEEVGEVIAFLGTLTGETPPLPWSNWPSAQ